MSVQRDTAGHPSSARIASRAEDGYADALAEGLGVGNGSTHDRREGGVLLVGVVGGVGWDAPQTRHPRREQRVEVEVQTKAAHRSHGPTDRDAIGLAAFGWEPSDSAPSTAIESCSWEGADPRLRRPSAELGQRLRGLRRMSHRGHQLERDEHRHLPALVRSGKRQNEKAITGDHGSA
jgi:hypothetical protein